MASRASPDARRGTPGNLVLVLIDTLRQDHLRTYGYSRETAPVLTRLASEGAALDGLAPTSWTKPAVASLFTGLHPLRHQVIGLHDVLPESAHTLAEILGERGYRSLGVTANGFSGKKYGMAQGFDELLYLADAGHGPFASSEEVNDEVFRRLAGLRPPFFLFVHYLDPHAPYEPPAWGSSWIRAGVARAKPIRIQDLEMQTFMARSPDFLAEAINTYDGEILRVGRSLDRLLGRLDDMGVMGSTLTVVVSDHGEEFQEHGRMGHGQSLYEEAVRVPLILCWPGVIRPGTRHGTTSLLDVFPTVLELLGAGQAAGLDGESLGRNLREGRRYEPGGREFLLHLDVSASHFLALRRGSAKLVLGRYPRRKELFDLASDPLERSNLLTGAVAGEGLAPLAARLAHGYNLFLDHTLPRVAPARSEDSAEALAALGYLGGAGPEGRDIPPRIRPTDGDPAGPLGWEEPRQFRSCLDLSEAAAGDQLLDGWYAPEENGRWTWPSATLLSVVPSGAHLELKVSGLKRDAAPQRLHVFLDGAPVLDQEVPAGAFALSVPLAGRRERGTAQLRILRSPPYVPAFMGPLDRRPVAPPDHRQLGHFLKSICIGPAGAGLRARPGTS